MTDSIDTNIILRYILGDIPEQRRQVAEYLKHSPSTHFISNQVLLECIYAMEITLDMPRAEITDLMAFFLARYSDKLEYDRDMLAEAFPHYLNHPKLSWVDCALSAEAKARHHAPVVTFDKKFATQIPGVKLLTSVE